MTLAEKQIYYWAHMLDPITEKCECVCQCDETDATYDETEELLVGSDVGMDECDFSETDCDEAEPALDAPTIAEPALAEPTTAKPALAEPTTTEPTLLDTINYMQEDDDETISNSGNNNDDNDDDIPPPPIPESVDGTPVAAADGLMAEPTTPEMLEDMMSEALAHCKK